MASQREPAWNLKTVIGAILAVTSLLIFAGSFERERAGFSHPTNIYTYGNAIAFLVVGVGLFAWGRFKR